MERLFLLRVISVSHVSVRTALSALARGAVTAIHFDKRDYTGREQLALSVFVL